MDYFKRESQKLIGIGGIKCRCCNKAYRNGRKKLRRYARRIVKQIDNKVRIEEEL